MMEFPFELNILEENYKKSLDLMKSTREVFAKRVIKFFQDNDFEVKLDLWGDDWGVPDEWHIYESDPYRMVVRLPCKKSDGFRWSTRYVNKAEEVRI